MTSEVPPLGSLTFTRFRVAYKVLERAPFPAHKALLFRRGLPRDIREAACGDAPGLCPPGAPLPYVYVAPVDDRIRLFVGDALKASLVLVGPAMAHASCYIHALDSQVQRGLGPQRCRVILEQVDWLDPRDRKWTRFYFSREHEIRSRPVPFDGPLLVERAALLLGRPRVTLQLATPLRLPGAFSAASLLTALHGRLAGLAARWCGALPIPRPPLDDVRILDSDLAERARPRRAPELTGTVTLGGALDPWFPLLVAGQHLHLGLGAALGFGRYELRP